MSWNLVCGFNCTSNELPELFIREKRSPDPRINLRRGDPISIIKIGILVLLSLLEVQEFTSSRARMTVDDRYE